MVLTTKLGVTLPLLLLVAVMLVESKKRHHHPHKDNFINADRRENISMLAHYVPGMNHIQHDKPSTSLDKDIQQFAMVNMYSILWTSTILLNIINTRHMLNL